MSAAEAKLRTTRRHPKSVGERTCAQNYAMNHRPRRLQSNTFLGSYGKVQSSYELMDRLDRCSAL